MQDNIKQREGKNLSPVDQQALEHAKYQLEEVRKAISEISLDGIDFDALEDVPTEKLEQALKDLEAQEKRLAGTDKQAAQQMAENKRKVQAQITRNKQAVQDYANAEKVAANTGKYNVTELKQAYETLQQKLLSLNTSQTRDISKTKKQMADLKAKIDEVTGSVKKQSSTWDTAVKNITAYVGVFGAFNWIKSKVQEIFRSNVELSDSLANIRKVSGLTSSEIGQLYTNISKIDTRNSVQQLNNLAYAGAKLGIQEHGGVAALTGFVRAAEQVQMALGEDLGEDALPAMAKLTEVMGLITQYGVEEAMQKAASAVFMLSTTSTSTGANIIEFSKRLMGLANVSHITADELLALGSASDAMGLIPEVASTAFNKVFTKIQSNTAAIEKAVGIQQGVLKNLVDEGKTMEAIVTVFDNMREMSMEEMQRRGIFTALGSDGARLNNVMTTMADRVDMLKKHLVESNKAFEDGEAVIAEYMIQNETAAAYMERASNLFEKAFTNTEGVDFATNFAKEWHKVALEMTQSNVIMGQLKAALYMLAAAAKILMAILPTLVTFLLFKGSLTAVGMLVKGFTNMAKGIWACVTASKALTAAQKWNAVATALSVVAAAFVTWKAAADEAAEAAERARERQAELDKAFAASKDTIAKSVRPLEEYKQALDNANLSQEERDNRLRAYLKNEYQPYLDFLGIEIDKVEDLADAYAQVVFAMKQKSAAEEKENYRNNVNGENRNNRIASQAEVIREAERLGMSGIDKDYLEKNSSKSFDQIYGEMMKKRYGQGIVLVTGTGETYYYDPINETRLDEGSKLRTALKDYQKNYRTEKEVDKQVEKMFNEEYKDLDLENFSLKDFREKQLQAQIEREKKRKQEVVLPPTKEELKEQKAAEKAAKDAIRKDLKDAKEDSDAIISKIEEWYRLQETVITDMQADGRLTKEQAEQVVRTLNVAKNTALRDARLAISGRDTEAWEQTKQQIGQLMLDQGKWSSELLQQILGVSMEGIRRNLARIDAGGGKYGITTTSLKDAIDKNAAGNQREIARLQAKSQQEVEKLLLQYHFVEQAIEGFSDRLAQMGILTETARHMAERLADANDAETLYSMKDYNAELQLGEESKRQAVEAFIKSGTRPYAVDPENLDQLRNWFQSFVGQFVEKEGPSIFGEGVANVEYEYTSWAKPFEQDFEQWLRDSPKYKSQIQAFYFSLMQTEEEYFDARKKAYNKAKKDFDQMWEVSGKGDAFSSLSQSLDLRNRQLKLTGADKGTNFVDQAGFSNLNEDPEIAQSILRMEQAQQELEMLRQVNAQKKLEGDELLAHQQLLHEKEQALADASMSMQEAIMAKINDRISKISEWTTPIENFGSEVGKALYDQWHNGESITSKWQDLLKSMALSWGQTTVSIVKELMIQKLKQRLINKAMQAESIAHEATMTAIQQAGGQSRQLVQQTTGQALVQGEQATNTTLEAQQAAHNATTLSEDVGQAAAETPVNISRAAGKTLANLGWWGIPLIAVITALLNGLLQAALGSSNKSNKSESSSSSSAAKMKLVSGMLTYDEGNTQSYLGTDGHVYRARQATPPEGVSLVTRPIATTVQGQPALVAERGPEIVIGRRTTRAIQMNEPELLTRLAQYDRHHSGPRLRTFDDGNLADSVPGASPSGESTQQTAEQNERIAAALDQNTQMMAAFVQMMTTIQRQGIPAHINKYGTGGLIDEVKSGLKFDAKYNR